MIAHPAKETKGWLRPRPVGKSGPNAALLAAALFLVLSSLPIIAQEAPSVPRWQPHDFGFTAKAIPQNPFMATFTATVTAPDGKSFELPGFFDGNGIWKIRISPSIEGRWTLVTHSELAELDGQRASLTCVPNQNPKIHGVLRVDSEHPHHFIFDDGTHFFMQGYEYDWLWALDMDKLGVPTVKKSLDLIARYGFDYVILKSYAHDTSWREGKSSDDDYGPSALYPWEGSNRTPNHSRMNLAYWQHYDQVMTALVERGIEAHMLIKVYNKQVNWPAHGSDEEKLFFHWLIARYSAYPNLIWDFSKEAHHEKDLSYKQAWLKYLRQSDPNHHLTTVHDDDQANDSGAYDDLTDFRADQQHSSHHQTILRQRARRQWPVANVEFDYECGARGVDDKTYDDAETPEQTVRTAWDIAMAGGYTAYYYTYTAWDIIRPLDVPKGYNYFKNFSEFWRGTEYWMLQPSDKLVSTGWCLANHDREYVTFQKTPTAFTLDLSGISAPLRGEWFNPFSGIRKPAGSFGPGVVSIASPSDWGEAPVILHLSPF